LDSIQTRETLLIRVSRSPLLSLFSSPVRMNAHAIRITLPYADLSGIIAIWAEETEQVAVYEHEADDKVSNTHCHILLLGCKVKEEALKRKWPEAPGSGNGFWKWKSKYGTPDLKFITYMSKGKLRPKYLKNISPAQVEELRTKWIEPTPKVAPSPAKSKEKNTESHYEVILRIKSEAIKNHGDWFTYQTRIDNQCFGAEFDQRVIVNHQAFFGFMCSELNKAKIRTSQNELERFYVTLMRQFSSGTENLFSTISKKLNLY